MTRSARLQTAPQNACAEVAICRTRGRRQTSVITVIPSDPGCLRKYAGFDFKTRPRWKYRRHKARSPLIIGAVPHLASKQVSGLTARDSGLAEASHRGYHRSHCLTCTHSPAPLRCCPPHRLSTLERSHSTRRRRRSSSFTHTSTPRLARDSMHTGADHTATPCLRLI